MAAVSNKPWSDITQADYADAGEYCDASLINLNTGSRDGWAKGNCKLPVREPGGALNRNAVFAAAVRLGQTDAPPEAKRAAARKLAALYRELNIDPPASVQMMARM